MMFYGIFICTSSYCRFFLGIASGFK